MAPLQRAAIPRDTVALARFLLGKIVVRRLSSGILTGRIVETEAYLHGDAAAHSFRGETPRNRSLFLEAGHAYVYLCYGTSYMLNVSSEEAGTGAGVLLRALEPVAGVEHMRRARKNGSVRNLARGPGRVFTRDMILQQIWGDSAYRDPRTIDVHIRHLREKLEPDPKDPEYLSTVRGVGYRFRDL